LARDAPQKQGNNHRDQKIEFLNPHVSL